MALTFIASISINFLFGDIANRNLRQSIIKTNELSGKSYICALTQNSHEYNRCFISDVLVSLFYIQYVPRYDKILDSHVSL